MWLGREGAKRLVERKWHGESRGDGADVLVKDRAASAWILSVSVRENSDLSRRVTIATCRLAGCHAGVATLLRGRGNVVMGPWQPMNCHAVTRMCLPRMDLCLWKMDVRG